MRGIISDAFVKYATIPWKSYSRAAVKEWTQFANKKTSWDDWVPQDRVRKLTPENVELATELQRKAANVLAATSKRDIKSAKGKAGKKGAGSDFSSARGSEERQASNAPGARGPRRNRDYDLETVSAFSLSFFL